MKKIFATIVLSLLTLCLSAQDFIYTVDGNAYWTDENVKDIKTIDELVIEVGRKYVRIPKSDIVLIEYMEGGVVVLQPEKIKKVEPVAFNGDLLSFMERGKRVFIPYSSSDLYQRTGARRLRELLMESGYWNIVPCEKEADFIFEYVFDDKGNDHAYLMASDRTGKKILSTNSKFVSGFSPTKAARESAEKLYKKVFTNRILKGKLGTAARQESPKKSNHFCPYYISI